jgi:hypothetical protein
VRPGSSAGSIAEIASVTNGVALSFSHDGDGAGRVVRATLFDPSLAR